MPKEKIPYTTGATKRGKLVKPPTIAKIRTMAGRAGDEDDTQKPPQTQQGVPSPLRVLHRTPGLSAEEYKELLRQMSGPVTESVINTYATFAELIVEKRGDTTKAANRRRVPGQSYQPRNRDERGALIIPARGAKDLTPKGKAVASLAVKHGSKKAQQALHPPKAVAAALKLRAAGEKRGTKTGHITPEYMEKTPFRARSEYHQHFEPAKSGDSDYDEFEDAGRMTDKISTKGHPKMKETRKMRANRRRGERAAEIEADRKKTPEVEDNGN